ncbi:hypothetical protein [Acutalibacter caecimuris]|uniref:hypothetical protein n=1 Tax=Acutalibacter caecimuris TaxID=3093657 RepID=UPI002AC9D23F|nr:hypothetical protein [Acutalibacter sp. M00118]
MKIALTYTAQEARQAAGIIHLIRGHLPGVMARKSDRSAPFYHVYLTTGKTGKAQGSGENA